MTVEPGKPSPVTEPLPWHQSAWARCGEQLAAGRLPHALLLTGAEGTGKARFALALARMLQHVFRCPVDDGNLRAGFINLSMQHDRADMVRAAMEGVALNTGWALQAARKFLAAYEVDRITVIGGGGVSDTWCQVLADVMNVNVRQPEAAIQSNVLGSAFIAATGLGEMDFADVPERVRHRRHYQPDPTTRQTYDDLAGRFADAHKTLAPFYRRMNSNTGDSTT